MKYPSQIAGTAFGDNWLFKGKTVGAAYLLCVFANSSVVDLISLNAQRGRRRVVFHRATVALKNEPFINEGLVEAVQASIPEIF
jgi:hypothetical protein